MADIELTFLQDLPAHTTPQDDDLLLINTQGEDKSITFSKIKESATDGTVKSVNSNAPDAAGNVNITAQMLSTLFVNPISYSQTNPGSEPDLNSAPVNSISQCYGDALHGPGFRSTIIDFALSIDYRVQIAIANSTSQPAGLETRIFDTGTWSGWESYASKSWVTANYGAKDTASLGQVGWYRNSATGRIRQWGYNNNPLLTHITLPLTFPTLITSIGATSNSPNHPALVMAKIIDNGTVAFDIANLDGVAINTEGFYWWVEGY